MDVVTRKAELRARLKAARRAGSRIGVVPTMGALHQGHLSLVQAARQSQADFVVVTIFVNPLQFGENEDLDNYPRTFETDLEKCRNHDVDLVFSPTDEEMYEEPFGFSLQVLGLGEGLESTSRPTHFAGVATVVAKLFGLCSPCLMVFGKKDYQQLAIVRKLAADFEHDVQIVAGEIVREDDGIAMSSRNRYLSETQRSRARSIFSALKKAQALLDAGESLDEARRQTHMAIDSDGVDYVAFRDAETLALPRPGRDVVLLVAARYGKTRLLDNMVMKVRE